MQRTYFGITSKIFKSARRQLISNTGNRLRGNVVKSMYMKVKTNVIITDTIAKMLTVIGNLK